MSVMVERVAKAVQEKLDNEFEERGGLAAEEMANIAARAAIEAMREPTEKMLDCGDHSYCEYGQDIELIWNAMIDAALSDND